ncbi:ABC transporter ATP-binding protein [Alkalicoccus luteus]|uniref:ABC transporter ATP-binding protein n=1 Tax=Alkalicoccus luteus TaxID=1237094 RepID=A0A969TVS4_9BACI|nr:ABC transporter ATP-binding protein [Alkalicoccus luteus]NJP38710.1 ABC transporter ATP-binding protein [Alkalicoccus luteus]
MAEQKPFTWRRFYELIRMTKPPVWILAAALILSLFETAVGLLIPLFTQQIVDSVTAGGLETGMIVLFLGLFLLQAAGSGVSMYLLTYTGEHIVRELRSRIWHHILRLPVEYFDNVQSGETVSRLINDTGIVKGLITRHLVSAVTGVLSMTGAVIILLWLDWQMTLVMLTAVPVMLFIIIPLGRKMYRISKSLQQEMASYTAVLSTVLSEIRLVKMYTAEKHERQRGETRTKELFRYGLKEAKVLAILHPLMMLAMMLMLVFIIGFGGVRVAAGALTAGELVAFILYLFMIIVPVSQFSSFFAELQKAAGATERIRGLLDEPEEPEASDSQPPAKLQPLSMEQVSFAYDREPVITDVSFNVPAGSVTAVVGPSGAGKTTLFSLIERFYEPGKGSIRYGNDPVTVYPLRDWRRKIGYVSQESPLLAGTIRENLMYGLTEEPPEYRFWEVLEAANASSFVQELPDKLDTEVGERGIRLSGGQKQRIAIARALLRDPEVLLLDEATASLDSQSEKQVQEALEILMKGRTTIIIAHRFSTISGADQIIVMENGRVTGRGSHRTLYDSHSLYRKLADHQLSAVSGR